jgi:hypothetical protein
MSGAPPGESVDPSQRLSPAQHLLRIAPIAVLIVLGIFAKWELAVIVILVLFAAIAWSALRKRRASSSGPPAP